MNTFKRFDYVRDSQGDTWRVARVDGPYVYGFDGVLPCYHAGLKLVEPKFKPGDVVNNSVNNHKIDRVKTETLGRPYSGPIAYEYINNGGWDTESGLTLVRHADGGQTLGDLLERVKIARDVKTMPDIIRIANDGRKIEAIKAFRTLYGAGLKEAKDAVEAIVEATVAPVATPTPGFKVGDKVRHRTVLTAGIGTIISSEGDDYWKIEWVNNCFGTGTYPACSLILAEKDTPHIVAIYERGNYRPNSNPHIHETKSAAVAEAERLSRKHPGVKFGTFALVADSHTPVVVTRQLGETKTVHA